MYAFDPAPQVAVPIVGSSGLFPVHRIFCVGRNYAAHALEMGNEVDREAPFYFNKSAHAIRVANPECKIAYPPRSEDVHHEMEFIVALAEDAKVFGYATGLDMTRRDLQSQAKEKRRPWDVGKDFEDAAVISAITPAAGFGSISNQAIRLEVNGEVRQSSTLDLMIWSVEALIKDLSTLYTLQPGDLIYTGTPEGVGPVKRGDRLVGHVDGAAGFTATVV